MNINYKINKNEIIEKFKDYITSITSPEDNYNSKGKTVQFKSSFNTLEKVKSIYNFIIDKIKLDIRREFIHDDVAFKKVIGMLETRVNNKIRSKTDGEMFLKVGVEKPIVFDGDEEGYEEWVVRNKTKQYQVVRKAVEELNAVLEGNPPPEEGKTIINDIDKNMNYNKNDLTNEEVVEKILENIQPEHILELFAGIFNNFDEQYNKFVRENNIDVNIADVVLETFHKKCVNNSMFANKVNSIDEDKRSTDVTSSADIALKKKRNQSITILKNRGLEASGPVWVNASGVTVAKLLDNGNIKYITNKEVDEIKVEALADGSTSDKPNEEEENDSDSSSDQSNIQQATDDIISQQSGGNEPEDEPEDEPEVETGLNNKELETLRKTFD
tara:strand:- start:1504 stop:2658 length:1155 start_codon:yes stop_codon:yes gene_type:complete